MMVRTIRLRIIVLVVLGLVLVISLLSSKDRQKTTQDWILGMGKMYSKGDGVGVTTVVEESGPTDVPKVNSEANLVEEEELPEVNDEVAGLIAGQDQPGEDDADEIDKKKVKDLTDSELQIALQRAKDRENDPTWRGRYKHNDDPLYGTLLDNDNHTRPGKAPVPEGYVGSMQDTYSPYEQARIVKRTYGNPDKVPRATFFTLVRNSELYGLIESIQKVESRFNHRMNYDWVFVNDRPFSREFIEVTSSMVSGTARYGIIPHEHWSYPSWIDQDQALAARESRKFQNVVYGQSESYRHMCRYNSKFFYRHPIMSDYELYWRVEPEIDYKCDILQDPFKYMADTGTMYGFTIAFEEFPVTVESLWATSMEYFDSESIRPQLPLADESKDDLLGFVSDDGGSDYNMCHFWTNFEIANLSLWRSDLYDGYIEHLDHAGGFFYERWGDAPVHSIAVSLILPPKKVHAFTDISYQHTVAGTCPLDRELLRKAKCTCDPLRDWTITTSQSCSRKYMEVSRQEKPKDYDLFARLYRKKNSNDELRNSRKSQLRAETAHRKEKMRREKAEKKRQAAASRRSSILAAAESSNPN